MNRIVCAAIRAEDGDFIVGVRHYSLDMIRQIEKRIDGYKFYHRYDNDQGFVDNYGRYKTRKEAREIALAADQIGKNDTIDKEELYSEDLY